MRAETKGLFDYNSVVYHSYERIVGLLGIRLKSTTKVQFYSRALAPACAWMLSRSVEAIWQVAYCTS